MWKLSACGFAYGMFAILAFMTIVLIENSNTMLLKAIVAWVAPFTLIGVMLLALRLLRRNQ